MLVVREEEPGDVEQVRDLNLRAFGQTQEADLVDVLRVACPDVLSLVAESGGRVIGHILFSPATVPTPRGVVRGMALGPMAVRPEHQRSGVGTRLVESGIRRLGGAGCPFIIVLGHPEYYPRFGFERASLHDIACQWEVPDEAFMALILDRHAMAGAHGVARYRDEFDAAL